MNNKDKFVQVSFEHFNNLNERVEKAEAERDELLAAAKKVTGRNDGTSVFVAITNLGKVVKKIEGAKP